MDVDYDSDVSITGGLDGSRLKAKGKAKASKKKDTKTKTKQVMDAVSYVAKSRIL